MSVWKRPRRGELKRDPPSGASGAALGGVCSMLRDPSPDEARRAEDGGWEQPTAKTMVWCFLAQKRGLEHRKEFRRLIVCFDDEKGLKTGKEGDRRKGI